MIKLLSLFLLLMSNVYGASVEVTINPKEPVVDENFELIFTIESRDDSAPAIRFNPGLAEVKGRNNRGVSISTTIVNGRISSSRKMTVAYTLTAKRAGTLYIRDIEVETEGQVEKVESLRINVMKEAREPRNVFVRAESAKEEYYVGEGIDLKYYIYYRSYIVGQEIKEFPKLNGFIKRFHKNINNTETVQVDGVVYKRTLLYSARLYPEKIGPATIDPLRISIQYSDVNSNSPFGTFGIQLGRYKERSLSSKPITLKILPVPAENAPKNYTGLVGKHSFSLEQREQRFLVNQAVEFRLNVEGEGALEKMDAPIVYSHPELEQFDTRTEVIDIDSQIARKQFDYTMLPRSNLSIDPHSLELSTFNPSTGEFETHSLSLPGLLVDGAGARETPASSPTAKEASGGPRMAVDARPQAATELGFLAPPTRPLSLLSVANWPTLVFYFSIGLSVVCLLGVATTAHAHFYPPNELKGLLRSFESEGGSYGGASHILRKVFATSNLSIGLSELVASSKLSKKEKAFMTNWIQKLERHDYGNNDKKMNKADKAELRRFVGIVQKLARKKTPAEQKVISAQG